MVLGNDEPEGELHATDWEGREESRSGDWLQPVPASVEKGSPRCRINHQLSAVSFLPDPLQVLALGSPGRAGHGTWVGATDSCGSGQA